MSALVKYRYYLASIVRLLFGFHNPARTIVIFLGWHGKTPTEIRLRRGGWRFKIRSAMDAWIIKETCIDQDYLWAVEGLLPDWTVVDIGAGLGDFTVLAANKCRDGVIHAYEPLTDSFSLLQHNVILNGLKNVQTYQFAVSATGGLLSVDSAPGTAAVSTRYKDAPGFEQVTAVSLDHILDALPKGRCDFLKIDCEGCEFDLLMESQPKLLERVDRISLEYHDDVDERSSDDLTRHLEGNGYSVLRKANPVHSHLGFIYAERIPTQ